MKRTALIYLAIVISSIAWSGNIIYPWRATTAIAKAGEQFEVWFDADQGQTISSVQLVGPYNTVDANFKLKKVNRVYDAISENTYNTLITVKVPRDCPADRYDIVLNTLGGTVSSPAGVKVVKDYKSDYYILHFSDAHAFQKGTETVLHRLSAIIDIANVIDPEMAFNTGDNLYRPTDDRMKQLFGGNKELGTKGLNSLNAAIFTVAGNHDIDFDNLPEEGFYKEKADWWNKWWGLQSYFFSYGKGRFMVINNGWHGFKPTKQVEAIGQWLHQVGKGNLRVGAMHIRNKELNTFDSIANPGLILIGHNHHIASQNPSLLNNKPIQYIVNSVRDNMEFNLYKVDEKTGSYQPVGSSTAQVVYVENPEDSKSPELYKPKLTLTYANANDGSHATNTATIVNTFDFPIEQAKVRFVMPKGKKYTVSKGVVNQVFDGRYFHVVDLNINIEAKSTTQIKIKGK